MNRKAYLPGIFVPDAQVITDENGKQVYDRHGRPLWHMPIPHSMTRHWKSAGMRRKFEKADLASLTSEAAQELLAECTRQVPIYRGFARSTVKAIRSTIKYRERQKRRRVAQVAAGSAQ